MLQMVAGSEFATSSTDTRVVFAAYNPASDYFAAEIPLTEAAADYPEITVLAAALDDDSEDEDAESIFTPEYENTEDEDTQDDEYIIDEPEQDDEDTEDTSEQEYEYTAAPYTEEADTFAYNQPHRVMYLTFDDGPTRNVTPLILDALAEREVHATFFVVGSMVRANPDIMQRIVDEGHTVGIHSDSHIYAQIYASLDSFIYDVITSRDLIAEFTGYKPTIYRFPGGSNTGFNARIRNEAIDWLAEHGYVFFDWNASVDDSIGGNRTPAQLLARGLETVRADKVIMLAHDTQPATAEMIGELVDILAQDFVFDVLTSDVEPIHFPRR